ncbi:MAG: acetylxylan esterase [Bacteroides sp.]|nr:acetylxylan esterase [Bacteroides sp.]
MKRSLILWSGLLACLVLFAQPGERMVKVIVVPDHTDWNYHPGEPVKFEVTVTKNSIPIENVEIEYELSYDMMDPYQQKRVLLKNGKLSISGGTMQTAGFLRCRVFAMYEGNRYEGKATAAFEPERITPTTLLPEDFNEFWEKAKAENSRIPLSPRLRHLPERSSDKADVYEVSIQHYQHGGRIYGILCVPTAPGKYPAILRVPGAGIRPHNGNRADAENGFISLEIGIHGIPVTLDPQIYADLNGGGLSGYQHFNWDNRDKVYYKRVYLGCVRAVDYLFTLEQFDGKNLAVQGGSQGGALAIVTAALDNRVTGLVSFYPALCDLNGYLHNRAGGWPHLFRHTTDSPEVTRIKSEMTPYYDVVNFARQLKVPGFYSFGYNDMVCPPISMFSAYNVIEAPKTLLIMEEAAHFGYPEQWGKAWQWMEKLVK